MSRTNIDEWCKDCMRGSTCTQTIEECKKTPPVTKEQIYDAMVASGEANLIPEEKKI